MQGALENISSRRQGRTKNARRRQTPHTRRPHPDGRIKVLLIFGTSERKSAQKDGGRRLKETKTALALGSWLLALGSWLLALGSWLLAMITPDGIFRQLPFGGYVGHESNPTPRYSHYLTLGGGMQGKDKQPGQQQSPPYAGGPSCRIASGPRPRRSP